MSAAVILIFIFAIVQPADTQNNRQGGKYTISKDVGLVLLPTVVLDKSGHFVTDLNEQNFSVFENNVRQKLAIFQREDIPITVGLVIDSSGSIHDKRDSVNIAALTFAKASNRPDEVFVVNFSDEFYLDLEKDFTNDINELRRALEQANPGGNTALYDAIIGSLDHLKKGTREKKVLIVITDGEDMASRKSLGQTILEVQKSDAMIYTVGILDEENKRSAGKAENALKQIANASGGIAFFPRPAEVEGVCKKIAGDIRNQYVVGYYPENKARDGSYRVVKVAVKAKGLGKLGVRHRPGYYAGQKN